MSRELIFQLVLATLDAKTCKANSVVSTKLHENTSQYKGYYQPISGQTPINALQWLRIASIIG